MIFKHVVLQLYVSFNLTDVPLSVTLGLLLILIDLLFEVFLDPLLQSLHISDSLISYSLKLPMQFFASVLFCIEYILVLLVRVLKVCELIDVISQAVHLVFCLYDLSLLLAANVIQLVLVTHLEMTLDL
jgi:hypothetical protein